jgi:hypothetical protein
MPISNSGAAGKHRFVRQGLADRIVFRRSWCTYRVQFRSRRRARPVIGCRSRPEAAKPARLAGNGTSAPPVVRHPPLRLPGGPDERRHVRRRRHVFDLRGHAGPLGRAAVRGQQRCQHRHPQFQGEGSQLRDEPLAGDRQRGPVPDAGHHYRLDSSERPGGQQRQPRDRNGPRRDGRHAVPDDGRRDERQ